MFTFKSPQNSNEIEVVQLKQQSSKSTTNNNKQDQKKEPEEKSTLLPSFTTTQAFFKSTADSPRATCFSTKGFSSDSASDFFHETFSVNFFLPESTSSSSNNNNNNSLIAKKKNGGGGGGALFSVGIVSEDDILAESTTSTTTRKNRLSRQLCGEFTKNSLSLVYHKIDENHSKIFLERFAENSESSNNNNQKGHSHLLTPENESQLQFSSSNNSTSTTSDTISIRFEQGIISFFLNGQLLRWNFSNNNANNNNNNDENENSGGGGDNSSFSPLFAQCNRVRLAVGCGSATDSAFSENAVGVCWNYCCSLKSTHELFLNRHDSVHLKKLIEQRDEEIQKSFCFEKNSDDDDDDDEKDNSSDENISMISPSPRLVITDSTTSSSKDDNNNFSQQHLHLEAIEPVRPVTAISHERVIMTSSENQKRGRENNNFRKIKLEIPSSAIKIAAPITIGFVEEYPLVLDGNAVGESQMKNSVALALFRQQLKSFSSSSNSSSNSKKTETCVFACAFVEGKPRDIPQPILMTSSSSNNSSNNSNNKENDNNESNNNSAVYQVEIVVVSKNTNSIHETIQFYINGKLLESDYFRHHFKFSLSKNYRFACSLSLAGQSLKILNDNINTSSSTSSQKRRRRKIKVRNEMEKEFLEHLYDRDLSAVNLAPSSLLSGSISNNNTGLAGVYSNLPGSPTLSETYGSNIPVTSHTMIMPSSSSSPSTSTTQQQPSWSSPKNDNNKPTKQMIEMENEKFFQELFSSESIACELNNKEFLKLEPKQGKLILLNNNNKVMTSSSIHSKKLFDNSSSVSDFTLVCSFSVMELKLAGENSAISFGVIPVVVSKNNKDNSSTTSSPSSQKRRPPMTISASLAAAAMASTENEKEEETEAKKKKENKNSEKEEDDEEKNTLLPPIEICVEFSRLERPIFSLRRNGKIYLQEEINLMDEEDNNLISNNNNNNNNIENEESEENRIEITVSVWCGQLYFQINGKLINIAETIWEISEREDELKKFLLSVGLRSSNNNLLSVKLGQKSKSKLLPEMRKLVNEEANLFVEVVVEKAVVVASS